MGEFSMGEFSMGEDVGLCVCASHSSPSSFLAGELHKLLGRGFVRGREQVEVGSQEEDCASDGAGSPPFKVQKHWHGVLSTASTSTTTTTTTTTTASSPLSSMAGTVGDIRNGMRVQAPSSPSSSAVPILSEQAGRVDGLQQQQLQHYLQQQHHQHHQQQQQQHQQPPLQLQYNLMQPSQLEPIQHPSSSGALSERQEHRYGGEQMHSHQQLPVWVSLLTASSSQPSSMHHQHHHHQQPGSPAPSRASGHQQLWPTQQLLHRQEMAGSPVSGNALPQQLKKDEEQLRFLSSMLFGGAAPLQRPAPPMSWSNLQGGGVEREWKVPVHAAHAPQGGGEPWLRSGGSTQQGALGLLTTASSQGLHGSRSQLSPFPHPLPGEQAEQPQQEQGAHAQQPQLHQAGGSGEQTAQQANFSSYTSPGTLAASSLPPFVKGFDYGSAASPWQNAPPPIEVDCGGDGRMQGPSTAGGVSQQSTGDPSASAKFPPLPVPAKVATEKKPVECQVHVCM